MIQPWIDKRWPDAKLSINLMRIAVGSVPALVLSIEAIADGRLAVSAYFIILGILVSILVYYGLTHRQEVSQRMRKAYLSNLVFLSYCLSATGFLMFLFAPFFPNVVL
jgi:hypothetical protein